jgi:phage FluMu protein Com
MRCARSSKSFIIFVGSTGGIVKRRCPHCDPVNTVDRELSNKKNIRKDRKKFDDSSGSNLCDCAVSTSCISTRRASIALIRYLWTSATTLYSVNRSLCFIRCIARGLCLRIAIHKHASSNCLPCSVSWLPQLMHQILTEDVSTSRSNSSLVSMKVVELDIFIEVRACMGLLISLVCE